MPTLAERKALLTAQSAINADALTVYLTESPNATPGFQFTDTDGLSWQVVTVYADSGGVFLIAQWIKDDLTLSKAYRTFFNTVGLNWAS